MTLDLGDRMQLIAFLLRDYSPGIRSYIASRLPNGGTFFDIGANVGLVSFGIAAARSDVTIHAFEPNPANVELFTRNQQLGGFTSTRLVASAISDHEGDAGFTVPRDSGSGMMDETSTFRVPITTLDRYCGQHDVGCIDVLKLDVQGHEPEALCGAEGLLSAGAVQTVVCEISETQLGLAGNDKSQIFDPMERHGLRATELLESRPRFAGRGSQVPLRDLVYCDVAFERTLPRSSPDS